MGSRPRQPNALPRPRYRSCLGAGDQNLFAAAVGDSLQNRAELGRFGQTQHEAELRRAIGRSHLHHQASRRGASHHRADIAFDLILAVAREWREQLKLHNFPR